MTINTSNISASGETTPALDAEEVTPHDSTNLQNYSRSLYVGVTGNVTVVMASGGAVITFVAVLAGAILPVRCSRVNATDTTATSIVALY